MDTKVGDKKDKAAATKPFAPGDIEKLIKFVNTNSRTFRAKAQDSVTVSKSISNNT